MGNLARRRMMRHFKQLCCRGDGCFVVRGFACEMSHMLDVLLSDQRKPVVLLQLSHGDATGVIDANQAKYHVLAVYIEPIISLVTFKQQLCANLLKFDDLGISAALVFPTRGCEYSSRRRVVYHMTSRTK